MTLEINEEKFSEIITSLDKEIDTLSKIYENINKEAKKIDGSNDIWKSKTQESVYNYYKNCQ